MSYIAVVDWDNLNRIEKFQEYETEADALLHVARVIGTFPNAFSILRPNSGQRDWLVDPIAKTLSVSVPSRVLVELKRAKRSAFRDETIVRMSAQVSAWNSFDRVDFLLSISNMLDTSSMTAAQILAKDILLYTKNTAIPKVNSITDVTSLELVNPTLNDPFGDGTVWPT